MSTTYWQGNPGMPPRRLALFLAWLMGRGGNPVKGNSRPGFAGVRALEQLFFGCQLSLAVGRDA